MDLAELNLSTGGEVFLNDNFDAEEDGFYPGYTIYKSQDPNLLVFNNDDISGSMSSGEGPDTNHLRFYLKDDNKKVPMIAIRSFVSKKTQLLHDGLIERLGKPDYFESISIASYSVWEVKTTNNIYLLEHNYSGKSNGVPVEKGILYIIDMDDEILLKRFTNAAYSYYTDYMEARIEKDENYTYKQFADEEKEDGIERYLKAIQNPVKH